MQTASRKASGKVLVTQIAAQISVQILFSTGKSYPVEALRELLREILVQEANSDFYAVASISKTELITGLLELKAPLSPVGLELRITNDIVSLWAGPISSLKLADWLRAVTSSSGSQEFLQSAKEILGCIGLNQPIGQAEINRIFGDVDKRSVVSKLLEQGLIEQVAGESGRILFVVTEKMLHQFGLSSAKELEERLKSNPSE